MNQPMWKAERMAIGALQGIVVRKTHTEPTHLMVLCHGFGAPGDDLLGCAEYFVDFCDQSGIAPVFAIPQAPLDLSRMGMYGARAWWEINMARLMQLTQAGSFDELRNEIPQGLDEARQLLTDGIESLRTTLSIAHLPLILGGFSQGAMLAVDTSFRGLEEPPHTLVAYSGALICESVWRSHLDRLKETRIFQSHGRVDTILPVETGKWLHDLLLEANPNAELFLFDGPHTIPQRGLQRAAELML